jgi:hypothetical protein
LFFEQRVERAIATNFFSVQEGFACFYIGDISASYTLHQQQQQQSRWPDLRDLPSRPKNSPARTSHVSKRTSSLLLLVVVDLGVPEEGLRRVLALANGKDK